jgi:integrase
LRELMAIEVTGSAPAARHAGAHTVEQLGQMYIEHARKLGRKESTLTDYAMCLRLHLAPFFGDTPIRRISAKQIESLIVQLQRRGLRPKSVRNYVGTLSALLNFAVRKKWLAATPMTAVDLPAVTSGDELDDPLRFLLPTEVHALVGAALLGIYHAIDRALYLTAAFTGLRQGELRGLLWQHVDFDASRVRVFENLVRGTRDGEPVTTIQAWLGHGDLKTTQRYVHYAPAADEAERVARAFAISDNAQATSWRRGTVAS